MKNLKELKEERGQIYDNIRNLDATLKAEKRNRTEDETTNFRTWDERLTTLNGEIELEERSEARSREAALLAANVAGAPLGGEKEEKEKRTLFDMSDVMGSVMTGRLEGRAAELNSEALRLARHQGFNGMPSNGVNIPMEFFQLRSHHSLRKQNRDVQATGAATGTPYVPTNTVSFIDALRNDIVMMNMGAQMLTGQSGNINIPRKAAGAAVAAAAENTTSTETTPATDTVALSPKRITAFTDVSNQASIQSNYDILAITENDLYMATLVELQRQLIHGAGSGGEMTGLLGISGIGSVSTPTVTYAVIQNIIDEVALDNALIGNAGWLTNSFIRKLLKQKEEIANSGYKIWANDNTIDGFPVWMTNSVSRVIGGSASALIFSGNWADFIIAQFGAINLQRNDQVKSKEALTEVVIHSWWDCDARHPESFAADVAITA